MKRKLIVSALVICTCLITWAYQAMKFEQRVQELYIPLLEQYKENVTFESVTIDKFKFKVTFNKPKLIFKSNTLSFSSERFVVQLIPFTKKAYISSYGKKERSASQTEGLYAPDHHISVVIAKPFFGKALDDLEIKIENPKFTLFDAKSDMQVLDIEKYNLNLQHKGIDKDNYSLKINADSKNVRLGNVFTEFLLREVFKLFPTFQAALNFESKALDDYYYFLAKFDEIIGGRNENSNIYVTYSKEFLNQIRTFALTDDPELTKKIIHDILAENFDIEVNGKQVNKFGKENLSLKFNNSENSKLEFKINNEYVRDLTLNSGIVELSADYLQKVVNRDLNKLFSDKTDLLVFSQEDFVKLLKPFANVINTGLSGLIEYSRSEGLLTHSLKTNVNDYVIEFKGAKDKMEYNSELSIDNFKRLIQFFNNYTTNGIETVIARIGDQKNLIKFQRLTEIANSFGLEALNALNNNDPMQNPNSFLVKFKMKSSGPLQVNDKDWNHLLEDPRIILFLQNIKSVEEH